VRPLERRNSLFRPTRQSKKISIRKKEEKRTSETASPLPHFLDTPSHRQRNPPTLPTMAQAMLSCSGVRAQWGAVTGLHAKARQPPLCTRVRVRVRVRACNSSAAKTILSKNFLHRADTHASFTL
jgi:hypothetical protein